MPSVSIISIETNSFNHTIYGLRECSATEPTDTRYIGMCANLEVRLHEHKKESTYHYTKGYNCAKAEWIREVGKDNIEIIEIAQTFTLAEAKIQERYYLQYYLELGAALCNSDHNPNIARSCSKPVYRSDRLRERHHVRLLPAQDNAARRAEEAHRGAGSPARPLKR